MKQFYTDDERIRRIWDIEQVKDLLCRRQILNANEQRRQELDDLWVRTTTLKKTASLGSNWGYYTGMDEISNYYVVQHDEKRRASLAALYTVDPSLANTTENLGFGAMTNHHVSTPCVVLADDGRTAQGVWYSIGIEGEALPGGGCKAVWYYEKLCADFIREDGAWKLWHLFCSNDVEYEAGTSLGQVETFPAEPCAPEREFGTPTLPYLAHQRGYGWSDGYPAIPEPYSTWTEDIGYGPGGRPRWPKGHPNYRKEASK